MMDFFETLIEYIRLGFEYFFNFLHTLDIFLRSVLSASGMPLYLSIRVPSFLGAAVIGVFGIAAVKLLIGRSNA